MEMSELELLTEQRTESNTTKVNRRKIARYFLKAVVGLVVTLTVVALVGRFTWNIAADGTRDSDMSESPPCTYTKKELNSLFYILEISSTYLTEFTENDNHSDKKLARVHSVFSLVTVSDPNNPCLHYLNMIETQLANLTVQIITMNSMDIHTMTNSKPIKDLRVLQVETEVLHNRLLNLIQQHAQNLSIAIIDRDKLIAEKYRVGVVSVIERLRRTLCKEKIKEIVWTIKQGAVKHAVTKFEFFEDLPDIANEMVEKVVSQVWQFNEENTLEFIEKLNPAWQPSGYKSLLKHISILERGDAQLALKIAYKVREGLKKDEKKYISLKEMLPWSIRDLMWHQNCIIQNLESSNYMKMDEVEGRDCMTGNPTYSCDRSYFWKLTPFQESSTAPVLFRMENVGMSKYLTDESTSESKDTLWDIKLLGNKVLVRNRTFVTYIRNFHLDEYLYEGQGSWEDSKSESGSGDGISPFQECARLSEEGMMFNEGKWIIQFPPYNYNTSNSCYQIQQYY